MVKICAKYFNGLVNKVRRKETNTQRTREERRKAKGKRKVNLEMFTAR
jgi:hypothetical protein